MVLYLFNNFILCCCYDYISNCNESISPSNIQRELPDTLVIYVCSSFLLNCLILFYFCYEALGLLMWLDHKANLIDDYQTS